MLIPKKLLWLTISLFSSDFTELLNVFELWEAFSKFENFFGLSSFLIQSTLLQELLRAEPDIEIIPKFKYFYKNNIMGTLLIVHCLMFIATQSILSSRIILIYKSWFMPETLSKVLWL